jgi:putative transposase
LAETQGGDKLVKLKLWRNKNRNTADFKTRFVPEVFSEDQMVNEIAGKYELSPVILNRWKAGF